MGEQFSADVDGLRDRAPEADRTAADVAATVESLRTALAAEGEPWGTDEAGRAFAESYLPDQRRTMADLDALVRMLRQSGQDLRGLANDFENVDALAARRIANAGNVTQRDTELAVAGGPARSRSVDSVDPTARTDSGGRISPDAVGAHPITAPVPGRLINEADRGPAADTSGMERRAGHNPVNPAADPNGPSADDPGGPKSMEDSAPGMNEQPPGSLAAGPVGPVTNPGGGITTPPTGAPVPATGTPWSRPAAATTSGTTGTSAAARPSTPVNARPPWVSAPGTGATGAPPRPPGRPVAPRKDNRPARRTARPDSGESLAARLVRKLAEQYGVRAFGFDAPGIPDEVLLELVAAIDEVLPHNPGIALGAIGIRELPDGALTRLEWDAVSGLARIALALRAATDHAYLASAVDADERLHGLEPTRHPVFACVIRELGRVLDGMRGDRVSRD